MKFFFAFLWLAFAWWSLPALIITLPVLGIGFVILALWPGPPQSTTWAQYENDCLSGVHGDMAKTNAERGDYRHRVERERIEQIVEG